MDSAPDPYILTEAPAGAGYNDLSGKTQVYPGLVPGQATGVFIVAGQSNAGGYVNSNYTPAGNVHNLNVYNGGMYVAADPLLGSQNNQGSWSGRLADKLITAGKYARVVLVPISVGGTSIAQWQTTLSGRLTVAGKRLASIGLTPTAVLWAQGEQDAVLQTSQAAYTASLNAVIAQFRSDGFTCPWLVALETHDGAGESASAAGKAAVRAAQAAVVTGTIYQGPDADTLDDTNRYDGTHFNATGANAFATLWQTAINAHL